MFGIYKSASIDAFLFFRFSEQMFRKLLFFYSELHIIKLEQIFD